VTTEPPICKLKSAVLQRLQSRALWAPDWGASIASGACGGASRAIMRLCVLSVAYVYIVVACVENSVA